MNFPFAIFDYRNNIYVIIHTLMREHVLRPRNELTKACTPQSMWRVRAIQSNEPNQTNQEEQRKKKKTLVLLLSMWHKCHFQNIDKSTIVCQSISKIQTGWNLLGRKFTCFQSLSRRKKTTILLIICHRKRSGNSNKCKRLVGATIWR